MSAAVGKTATETAWSAVWASVRWTSIISRRRALLVTRRRATITGRGPTVTGRRPPRTLRQKISAPLSKGARRWNRRSSIIAFDAEHTAGARVGIEPEHAAVGGHPFEAITRIARGSYIGALHIGQTAGALAANAVHDLVQRADFAVLDTLAGPIRLCGDGRRGGCCTQQKQGKYGCKIPHGPTSMPWR